MVGVKSFLHQPVKNHLRTYQGKDNTTGCLLDYNHFKKYYQMLGIDLSKQQAFDADPKAIQ